MSYQLVLSTASSIREARKIAKALLDKRLAACINIVPSVESHYVWKKRRMHEREVLLFIKTRKSLFRRVEKAIKSCHSCEVPEIIALSIEKGSRPYLDWIKAATV